jgi:hypothetical protein
MAKKNPKIIEIKEMMGETGLIIIKQAGIDPLMRKHGAQNLQTKKRVTLAILSLVQSYYDNRSLKGIRFTLSLGFEEHIQTIFKLLNAQAIRNLLLPRSG